MRRTLGLSVGESVVLDINENSARLRPAKQVLKDVQAMVKSSIPEGVSLVDELIQDRRAEFAKEEEKLQKWLNPDDRDGDVNSTG